MGKQKPPSPSAAPKPPENPDANEEAKAAAGAASQNAKRRSLASQSEGAFGKLGTAAQGAAPTNAPTLKTTLGA